MKERLDSKLLLSAPARRCLATLLGAELDGAPVEFYTWRAKNARKIPLLEELQRNRMIEGDTDCVVKFWGLMNAPGERAKNAMDRCERVFKALKNYYPKHPKEPLGLDALAKKTKLTEIEALQSAQFLSRSPIYLSIHTNEQRTQFLPNEQYVIFSGFEEVKVRARKEVKQKTAAFLQNPFATGPVSTGLTSSLEFSENETVRENWRKAVDRISSDPAGAITAARSLVEAACKHVIEELDEMGDTHL